MSFDPSSLIQCLSLRTILALASALLTACGHAPQIELSPRRGLVDEALHVRINHLEPFDTVAVVASTTDSLRRPWTAQAEFVADRQGIVDVFTTAPLHGSYQGIAPMALITSMRPDTQSIPGNSPYFGTSVTTPWDVRFTVRLKEQRVVEGTATRLNAAEDVRRIEIRDSSVVGTLFLPKVAGKRPAVIVLPGSNGGIPEPDAAALASHGYVALALAYFGYPGLPKEISEVPVEIVQRAVQRLLAEDRVDANRIALRGASKGAELALVAASHFSEIKAVIAISPSDVVWNAVARARKSSWSINGLPLPFVPFASAGIRSGRLRDFYYPQFDSAALSRIAQIPVERINGPILFVSGDADELWPSGPMAERAIARANAAHFPYLVRHLSYHDAGHVFLIPFIPIPGTENRAARASAAEDAWQQQLKFLSDALRVPR